MNNQQPNQPQQQYPPQQPPYQQPTVNVNVPPPPPPYPPQPPYGQPYPQVNVNVNYGPAVSYRSRLVALLLCLFLGTIGVHRFYVGKISTGIIWIVTLGGGFGIGTLVDLIMIIVGSFRDKEGRVVSNWNA